MIRGRKLLHSTRYLLAPMPGTHCPPEPPPIQCTTLKVHARDYRARTVRRISKLQHINKPKRRKRTYQHHLHPIRIKKQQKKSNANQKKLSKHTSTYFSSIYKRVPWASREKAAPHHTLLTRPLLHLAPNFSFFSKLYLPSWAARSFRYRCLGDLMGPRASVRRGVVVH
jgi:hypothetical protein